MIAIITPAKGMDEEKIDLNIETTTPRFLDKSKKVMDTLKGYEIPKLTTLMKINDKIAEVNFRRNQDWEVYDGKDVKPAVLSFSGEVYRGIDAINFNNEELRFCNSKLRILSGVYGSLRPLDGMLPYRLEMGTKLSVDGSKDLYDFWTEELTQSILEDARISGEEVVVNLASNEYGKVLKLKKKIRVVNVVFKERKGLKYRTVVVHTKKARGMMINFMVKNKIDEVEKLKEFDYDRYEFSDELSDSDNFVFTRDAL
ncbi:MAG: peroxide stress protein YaaA [Sarcina sp.]